MKTSQKLSCFLTACVILSLSFRASAKKTGGDSYGIVNMQKVILTVKEGVQARKQLEQEFKKKQEDLVKQKKELDELNKTS